MFRAFSSVNRKVWAVILAFVLMIVMISPVTVSLAEKAGVTLDKDSITVKVGKTTAVKIKNVKKKQVKKLAVKSKDTKVAKAKKKGKLKLNVTGVKTGKTKVTVTVKLKKNVPGKKKYKLKLKVTVTDDKVTPTASVSPTATPAPTPVVSGASITIEKPEYRCNANTVPIEVVANILPATANEPVEWEIADKTIAMVDEEEPTEDGQASAWIYGLKEGSTYITAKIGAGATTARIIVEKQIVAARLSGLKQTKANELELSLDIDFRKDNQGLGNNKFDVDVYNSDGIVTKTIPVNSIDFQVAKNPEEQGSTATMVLDSPFSDGDKVVVTLYKGKDYESSWEFTASVGAPAAINVVTNEAQRGIDTPIKVALYDTKGIDVSSTVDMDSRVAMEVECSTATWNTSPISAAKIKMDTVGAAATVRVAYTSAGNTTGKPDFQNTGVINCIEPKPVVGTPRFMYYSEGSAKTWKDGDDSVAKFYRYPEEKEAYVMEGGSAVYSFCATNLEDDEDALSYDEYSVMSSNGDIAIATVDKTGKYCNITIDGMKAGKCNINVTAKKNSVATNYIIPVLVDKVETFSSFSIKPSRTTVSNCFDGYYQSENSISVTAYDNKGNSIFKSPDSDQFEVTYELISPKDPKPYSFKHSDGGEIILDGGFTVTGDKYGTGATFDATGAKDGAYTIKATAYYKGVMKTATCTIKVKAVPKAAYELDGVPPKAEYSLDISRDNLNLSGSYFATVRMKASIGGVFAGYVYMDQYDSNTYYAEYHSKNDKWRSGFSSSAYVGVIGDQLRFASGSTNQIAPDDPYYSIAGPNAVAPYYRVDGTSQILDFRVAAKAGGKWQTVQNGFPYENNIDISQGQTDHNINLFDREHNFTKTSFTSGTVFTSGCPERGMVLYPNRFASDSGGTVMKYYPDKKADPDMALPGNYTVMFRWKQSKSGDSLAPANLVQKSATVTVKVTDDMFVPGIAITKRTLDDFSDEGVKEALFVACDMNCNTSTHASVKALLDKNFKPIDYSGNSATVNYIVLDEGDYEIYESIGAAFYRRSLYGISKGAYG